MPRCHAQDETGADCDQVDDNDPLQPRVIEELQDEIKGKDDEQVQRNGIGAQQTHSAQDERCNPRQPRRERARSQRPFALRRVLTIALDIHKVIEKINGACQRAYQYEASEYARRCLAIE